MKLRSLVIAPFMFSIVACGGGGDGDGGGGSTPTVGVEGIEENVFTTNIRNAFPFIRPVTPGAGTDAQRTKRWVVDVDGLIPVKHKNISQAIHAMDAIESKLGTLLFDRNSILNTPDDEVERGIVVSFGTALGGPSGPTPNGCGHVGRVGGATSYDQDWYDDQYHLNGPIQVNIGSDDPNGCTNGANLNEIAIHEFMHALGMGDHFTGFGLGPIYDDNAWNALFNIYNNPVFTLRDDLVITKKF
jgi:hypothetical protein